MLIRSMGHIPIYRVPTSFTKSFCERHQIGWTYNNEMDSQYTEELKGHTLQKGGKWAQGAPGAFRGQGRLQTSDL